MPSAINAFKSPTALLPNPFPRRDGRTRNVDNANEATRACVRRLRHLLLDDVKCHRVAVRPFGGQGLIEVL